MVSGRHSTLQERVDERMDIFRFELYVTDHLLSWFRSSSMTGSVYSHQATEASRSREASWDAGAVVSFHKATLHISNVDFMVRGARNVKNFALIQTLRKRNLERRLLPMRYSKPADKISVSKPFLARSRKIGVRWANISPGVKWQACVKVAHDQTWSISLRRFEWCTHHELDSIGK